MDGTTEVTDVTELTGIREKAVAQDAPAGGVLGEVLAHARTAPHAPAVTDGETTLTYGELVASARRLADALRERGVRPGTAVGLLVPHSVTTVVAQLAVWWAGGHYVPLDPDYPQPRIHTMLTDAEVALTVGEKEVLGAAGIPAERALPLSGTEAVGATAGADAPYAGSCAPYDPDAIAYVMFTSGSTGRPKGVALTQRGIAALAVRPGYVTVTARDRVLLHSPLTFDASAFEVWGALANGAAVAVSTAGRLSLDGLARDAQRLGATLTVLTTALFHHLAARRSPLFGVLRAVLVGGEALSAQHSRAVLRAFPRLELINAYGPTEGTTFATTHRVTDADCDGPPPIGLPCAGASAHVLDERGEPVPAGERGELWIGGPRLARGYLRRPDLTEERFVRRPGLGRLYRSGDLVSARPDGTLDFHGRADDQVKVRGFRIEPGEIEHELRRHPRVTDAAVVVQRPSADDARLVAFVVPAPGSAHGGPSPEELRAHLEQHLPAHLVPNVWSLIEALPVTGTGKVDRQALIERQVHTEAAEGAPAALSPIQRTVAEMWSRALELEVDRPDADFFALGGHSLLALSVVEELREDLGVELTLPEFMAAPTVAEQASLVERALLAAPEESGATDGTGGAEARAAHTSPDATALEADR